MQHSSGAVSLVAVLLLGAIGYFAWQGLVRVPDAGGPQVAAPVTFTPSVPIVTGDDPRLGARDARYTVVVYSDFSCSACKEAAGSLRALAAERKDVAVIWKDMPNSDVHPNALRQAVAGRCAFAQGKFWEMHDALFADAFAEPSVLASRAALNSADFDVCMSDTRVASRVQAGVEQALRLGVEATPWVYVNGKSFGTLVSKQSLLDALLQAP